MSRLLRAVSRHALAAPARWLGVVVLVAIGIVAYAGARMAFDQIEETTADLYEDLALFDWSIRIAPAPRSAVPDAAHLAALEGVAAADWRTRMPGTAVLADGTTVAAAVHLVDPTRQPVVSDVLLTAGAPLDPTAPMAVLIDATFAADHDLSPGDRITLRAPVGAISVTIGGIGVFPEYLVASIDEHMTLPVRGSLIAVQASDSLLDVLAARSPFTVGLGGQVNDLVLRLRPGADPEGVRDAVLAELEGHAVREVTWWADQHSVLCHQSRLWVFRDFLPTLIAVFEALAATVMAFTLSQLAGGFRRETGILLTFGFSRARILAAWAAVIAAMVGAGVLLGAALTGPFSRLISGVYRATTGFPILTTPPDWTPLLHGAAVAALLVPLGVGIIARHLASPPDAMLRSSPQPDRLGLERWAIRLPLGAATLGIRSALRRPAATAGTTVSIAGTLVMAGSMYVFAQAQQDSTDDYLASRSWDALVALAEPREDSALTARLTDLGAQHVEVHTARPARINDVELTLLGWPLDSQLQGDGWLIEGRGLEADGEILLTQRDLRDLGAACGEAVSVQVAGGQASLKVVGVLHSYTLGQGYVSRPSLDALAGATLQPAGALIRGDEDAVRALQQADLGRVLPGRLIQSVIDESNAGFVRIIRAYGHLGAVAGLLLLAATMRVRAQERRREHAVLLSYGLSPQWILRSLAAEALLIGLLAGLIALPLTRVVAGIFQARIAAVWMYIPLQTDLRSVAAILLVPLALTPLAAILPVLGLARLDLVRALSTRRS